jgi:hypothetical protein
MLRRVRCPGPGCAVTSIFILLTSLGEREGTGLGFGFAAGAGHGLRVEALVDAELLAARLDVAQRMLGCLRITTAAAPGTPEASTGGDQ